MKQVHHHLMKTPITVTGEKVFFSEQAIYEQISGLGPYFPKDMPAQERLALQQGLQEIMLASAQSIKTPEKDFLSTPPELKKHFVMVSVSNSPEPFPPQKLIAYYAISEVIKRFLHQSGADVTTVDSTQEDSPYLFFCRDSFVHINDTILLPDQENEEERKIINLLQDNPEVKDDPRVIAMFENFGMGKHLALTEAKKMESGHMEDFLEDQNERVISISGTYLDGGNVIVDPVTKSVFIGLEHPEEKNANKNLIETIQRVIHRTVEGGWTVYPVPLKDRHEKEEHHNRAEYEDTIRKAAQNGKVDMLYHLDLGMSEPLANGEILICPEVTDPGNYQTIREVIGKDRIVEISLEEALATTANLISHGMNILISTPPERVKNILESKGYRVFSAKDYGLNNLNIRDGGPHCLTNTLSLRR